MIAARPLAASSLSNSTLQLMPRCTSVMNAAGGSAVSKISGSTTSMCVISQLAASKHSTSILTPDPTSSSVMIATGPLVASML
jgi:hypothetical protein